MNLGCAWYIWFNLGRGTVHRQGNILVHAPKVLRISSVPLVVLFVLVLLLVVRGACRLCSVEGNASNDIFLDACLTRLRLGRTVIAAGKCVRVAKALFRSVLFCLPFRGWLWIHEWTISRPFVNRPDCLNYGRSVLVTRTGRARLG